MTSGDPGSSVRRGDGRDGCGQYVFPSAGQLNPAKEAELGALVQRGNSVLRDLVDTLTPRITTCLHEMDCEPYSVDDIEPSIRDALQIALDEQCAENAPRPHVMDVVE